MLNDFITQAKLGISRINRYKATVFPPPVLGQGPTEQMVLFCSQALIPGITFSSAPQRIAGEVREFVYERTYDPLSLTFYVDGQMNIHQFFNNWQSAILDPNTRTVGYYEQYVTEIMIEILDVEESGPIRTIYIEEAYPKSVQGVALNSSDKGVMTMTASFVYKRMRIG